MGVCRLGDGLALKFTLLINHHVGLLPACDPDFDPDFDNKKECVKKSPTPCKQHVATAFYGNFQHAGFPCDKYTRFVGVLQNKLSSMMSSIRVEIGMGKSSLQYNRLMIYDYIAAAGLV